MNIFLRELKAHRKSLIWWCVGMFFMLVAAMGKYSTFVSSGQSMTLLLADIPKSIKAILGFGDFDLQKASGFYGMMYLYLVIMTTIHAATLGANIIAKEERDKTVEFLMVKPVSRTGIIMAKLLAAIMNVIILNLVTLFLSIAILKQFSNGESVTAEIQILMLGMFILQLIFLFIGTGIASISKNPAISSSIATTILLVAFIMSVIVDINGNLVFLKYLTPFKYYDARHLMDSKSLDPLFLLISFGIIAVMIFTTFIAYKKRDLKI